MIMMAAVRVSGPAAEGVSVRVEGGGRGGRLGLRVVTQMSLC